MTQFKVHEEGIEAMGQNIGATLDGMWAIRTMAEDILASVGLDNIVADENHWYSQQLWLDAFKLIAEKTGAATLRQIGKNIVNTAVLPPMNSIEEALELMDVAYHMNHRNARGEILFDPNRPKPMLEGIGHYMCQMAPGENKAFLIVDTPYPCAFDTGLTTAFAQHVNKRAKVQHDDEYGCRDKGDNACRLVITW